MPYVSAYFILLLFILYAYIEHLFSEHIERNARALELKKGSFDKMQLKFRQLDEDGMSINKEVEATAALYDLSKNMCKFMDEEKIFSFFKDAVLRLVKADDCVFLPRDNADVLSGDYQSFPLKMENKNLGILAVKNLAQEDKEKFFILTQQYLLAIRRASFYKEIQELAITDGLTGALSRRYSMERLTEETDRSRRFKLEFCVLMADIDHFKKYNDHYGHLVGDVVLKEIVGIIKENLRNIDLVARYGGEEFIVLLPETTKENGILVAERIRAKIDAHKIAAYDENIKATISIGLSGFPGDALDSQELIDKADWALYRCKNTGRNRVCSYKIYKE